MKKATAVILSIVIALSFAVPCFAGADGTFLVVLGDSIAYGTGLSNPVEANYGRIVADTNGYDYANHAIPGYTSAALISHMQVDYVAEDIAKADIIAISIGGNDFLTNDLTKLVVDSLIFDDFSFFDEIAAQYEKNLDTIVDSINAVNPDAVIMIQTIYNPQDSYLAKTYGYATQKLNAVMYAYEAANPGEIIVVDVATALNGDPDNFAADSIHPSAKGNELIAQAYADVLSAKGLGTNRTLVVNTAGKDEPMLFMLGAGINMLGLSVYILSKILFFI